MLMINLYGEYVKIWISLKLNHIEIFVNAPPFPRKYGLSSEEFKINKKFYWEVMPRLAGSITITSTPTYSGTLTANTTLSTPQIYEIF